MRNSPPAASSMNSGVPLWFWTFSRWRYGRRSAAQSAKSNQTIEDLLEYIRTHYQKPLSNQALAARFSYHPNHLSKLMVQYTGMSLHQYLLHVRITAAAQLLRSGDTAVSEAARAVGFESLSHFSRLFKQRIGCSPARYKEAAGI